MGCVVHNVGCFARCQGSRVTSAVPSPPLCSAQPWLLEDPTRSPAYDKTKQTYLKDVGVVLVGWRRSSAGGSAFGGPSLQTQRIGVGLGTLGAGRAAGQPVSLRRAAACCPARAGAERGELRFVCPP